jgi:hypothetical protein
VGNAVRHDRLFTNCGWDIGRGARRTFINKVSAFVRKNHMCCYVVNLTSIELHSARGILHYNMNAHKHTTMDLSFTLTYLDFVPIYMKYTAAAPRSAPRPTAPVCIGAAPPLDRADEDPAGVLAGEVPWGAMLLVGVGWPEVKGASEADAAPEKAAAPD